MKKFRTWFARIVLPLLFFGFFYVGQPSYEHGWGRFWWTIATIAFVGVIIGIVTLLMNWALDD